MLIIFKMVLCQNTSFIIASYYVKPVMKLRDWVPKEKIDWWWLSKNTSAIHLLEQHPDKIHWPCLSENPSAIHLLEQNPDKINWHCLSVREIIMFVPVLPVFPHT